MVSSVGEMFITNSITIREKELVTYADKESGTGVRNWNQGVNFTNILRAAFTLADPKCAKKTA